MRPSRDRDGGASAWGAREGGDYVAFPAAVDPAPIPIGGIMVFPQQLLVLGGAFFFVVVFTIFFRRTRWGKMMQATAENATAAFLSGIRVERVYTMTWGTGACIASAAAVLMAPLTLLSPDVGFNLLLRAFAATVLGGLGSMPGAIIGGFLVGIIGPNGAGKTTLLNVICGIDPPDTGTVWLDGESINGLKTSQIADRGIGRTFQTTKLFKGMTVLENVMTGLHGKLRANPVAAAFSFRSVLREEAEAARRAREVLEFVRMIDFADEEATALSFGQQRLVEIARALVSEPEVLLLDEPAVGLSLTRVSEVDELLRRIRRERGVTILMIEHVIRLVMGVCDRITVLNGGRKIADGTAEEVMADREVAEAYLGAELDD